MSYTSGMPDIPPSDTEEPPRRLTLGWVSSRMTCPKLALFTIEGGRWGQVYSVQTELRNAKGWLKPGTPEADDRVRQLLQQASQPGTDPQRMEDMESCRKFDLDGSTAAERAACGIDCALQAWEKECAEQPQGQPTPVLRVVMPQGRPLLVRRQRYVMLIGDAALFSENRESLIRQLVELLPPPSVPAQAVEVDF